MHQASDINAMRRTGTIAQCCGSCDQGRKPCASPDACRQPEDGRYSTPAEDAGFLAGITIACIALIAIVSAIYTVWKSGGRAVTARDDLPLGLVRGLPFADYLADPGVSNSMLSDMRKSPAHCYALHLDPDRPTREPTDAMSAGTLAHTAILEPDAMKHRYAVKPDGMTFATKEGKAWRDALPPNVLPISAAAHDAAMAQRAAVMRVGVLRRIFGSGIAEASIFWIDHETGLRCKARTDWLHFVTPRKVIALDLKTISELTPESVEKAVTFYGYHRQRAHYTNGLGACGLEVEDFGFAFVSSAYPFIAAPYLLDDETCEQGADEVHELLTRVAECQERNDWPAFGDGFQLTGLLKWARRSQEIEVAFAD